MLDILRNTIAPVTSLLIIMLGISFFNTFTSVLVTIEGWNNLTTGLIYSAYYGGMMAGALYIEKLIKITGHIRGFSLFAAITALSVLLHTFTFSPYSWLVYRFITGFASAGLFIVIESWLLLLSSVNTRGSILAIYMISVYSSQAVAQFILPLLDIKGITPFTLTTLFCLLSIIPVSLMRATAPPTPQSTYINIFHLLKKLPLGFLGNLIAGLILSAFYALVPVFANERGYTLFQTSLIMACTIFGGMALQWPIGFFSDFVEKRKMIIITSIILTIISSFLFFFDKIPFFCLILFLFFFGGFAFTLYPISITYCCDFFSSVGITSITCAALIIYGIGCIIGPILSPFFMEATKPSGVFLYTAITSFILALYAFYQDRKLSFSTKEPQTKP